ncbi:MAG: hypothetical protein IT406_01400 [Candidatus Yanofskybacteria bacterium]|nr:hypothetical protein [Candidatus Yanofskybacteria bacterium]
MKVIFLDIDGVMNNSETAPKLLQQGFDPVPLRCLLEILAATDAKIVVSGALGRVFEFEDLQLFFDCHGIPKDRVIGATRNTGTTRGGDISAWLAEHPGHAERYLVIDDADLDQIRPHGPRFLKTEWHIGLTPAHVRRAIRMLNA